MYEVFNMGHRLELYIDPKDEATTISIAKSFGIEAKRIGYLESFTDRNKNSVTLKTAHGDFDWKE
jgi:phosphoribosylformylglycinamidine cyclo-ligase